MSMESSFEQSKNFKRDFEKSQLNEKKALDELQWLRTQFTEQKAKLKALREEKDELQEQNLELKSSNMNRESRGTANGSTAAGGMPEFERATMQQAIDETTQRCKNLREENKKLDSENNFFHMSTAIFIKLKPVMETEKQLCYQLAQLNKAADTMSAEELESKRDKVLQSITKCRDTQSVMEVKLKKILDRIKKQQNMRSPEKKPRVIKEQASLINVSQMSQLLDVTNQSRMDSESSPAQSEKSGALSARSHRSRGAQQAAQPQ